MIVQNGDTLINCLAYIDLNPVRAGLVDRPEDYHWNCIGYHLESNNRHSFLSYDFGLKAFGGPDAKERLGRYQRFVYETNAPDKSKGAVLDSKLL